MHKGYSSLAPENSEAAFTLAGQQNDVYAIECDIRVTSDGKFVIYHNDNLADQTTGSGSVSEHTFNEVTSYTYDKNVNGLSTYPNEHVCSLETYLKTWHESYNMSEDMIALAYEYCIIQTAKLSFPYMDKIIERWYKQGIHDVLAAEEDNKNFKERKTTDVASTNDNGYTDLENLTRGRFDK